MQTRAFRKHARCPKRLASVKPYLPSGVVHVTPFALGKVMPAERQALDQIVATADLIETPAGPYLLVPANTALVETLAEYGAEAEDREDGPDDEAEPEGADHDNGVLAADRDPTDADFETGEDHEPDREHV